MDQIRTCVEALRALSRARSEGNRLHFAEYRISEFARQHIADPRAALERLRDAIDVEAQKTPGDGVFWLFVQDFVDGHVSRLFEDDPDC
jgi:hypothetical protein